MVKPVTLPEMATLPLHGDRSSIGPASDDLKQTCIIKYGLAQSVIFKQIQNIMTLQYVNEKSLKILLF